MVAITLDSRLDKAFNHLDLNRNGEVEKSDIDDLATRLMPAFDELPHGQKGRAIVDGFEKFWQTLLVGLDRDGDGRINPEESRRGISVTFRRDSTGFENGLKPLVKAVASLVDYDDDGELDFVEFQKLHKAFGISDTDIRVAFEHLDSDHSGKLSVKELTDAGFQFYADPATDATGNWLFGQI
jgi:Ca2+-binding EF-hand superfamily protein